ncbi:MAG: hypothetical protein ACE5NP_00710 [Anaerolineae bacterium]
MTDSTKNQLIANVARELVAQTAPQELPLFRATSEVYFKDPEKALKGGAGKDDMLGFGLAAAATFLTPVALAVASEVVEFVAEEVKESVEEESEELIDDAVKKVFKKFRREEEKKDKEKEEPPSPPPLTPEQLEEVRELALEKARQLNLSESQAELLADSLVGDLILPDN